ncbi:hypothetical protein FG386_002498 [Cryptosporidium ryanae]|uniref:uncharacterized protein n=1 Tax=Cryptosporidium ryanae TaxID=515981 RepID=UPI00351A524A|nr:hypothetical protein FG386_002498 [Cryptosporidium ryanae]
MVDVFQFVDVISFSLLLVATNSSIEIIYQNLLAYTFYILLISIIIYIIKYYLVDLNKGHFYLIHNFSFPLLLFTITKLNIDFETQISNLVKLFSILISITGTSIYIFGQKISISSFWIKYLYLFVVMVYFLLFTYSGINETHLNHIIVLTIIYHFVILNSISFVIGKEEYYIRFGEFNIFSQLISYSFLFSLLKVIKMNKEKILEWESCIVHITFITEILIPLIYFGINTLFNDEIFNRINYHKFHLVKAIDVVLVILAAYFPISYLIKSGTETCNLIFRMVMVSSSIRILLLYWVVTIFITILFLTSLNLPLISSTKRGKVILRKAFHLLVISIFIPPITFYKRYKGIHTEMEHLLPFTVIAIYASSNLYIILEITRKCDTIKGLTRTLNYLFMPFVDKKDNPDGFVITHICLLIGVSLPIIVEFSNHKDQEAFDIVSAAIGIATIGIGDTSSAIFGVTFGSIPLPGNKSKTLFGMISFLISTFISLVILCDVSLSKCNYSDLLLISFISSILESYTLQIDNTTIPLYTLAIYFNIR